MTTVSVVTPVHNSENFIVEAISSVSNQTFKDFEHIIVDDCSTDGSVSKIKNACLEDSRITLLELKENLGAAEARNLAIKSAKGKYIAFLDSDDFWSSEKLEKQIEFMRKGDFVLSCTGYNVVNEDGFFNGRTIIPPKRISYLDMLKSNKIGCLTAMYDVEKLGKLYMPNIRKRQDYGLWLRILKKGSLAGGLQDCLSSYRVRSGSISRNKVELVSYNWELFRKYEKLSLIESAYFILHNIANKVTR